MDAAAVGASLARDSRSDPPAFVTGSSLPDEIESLVRAYEACCGTDATTVTSDLACQGRVLRVHCDRGAPPVCDVVTVVGHPLRTRPTLLAGWAPDGSESSLDPDRAP